MALLFLIVFLSFSYKSIVIVPRIFQHVVFMTWYGLVFCLKKPFVSVRLVDVLRPKMRRCNEEATGRRQRCVDLQEAQEKDGEFVCRFYIAVVST